CQMHSCFDYSRCSLTSQFPVYVYPLNTDNSPFDVTSFVQEAIRISFSTNRYITNDPSTACLYVVVVGESMRPLVMRIKRLIVSETTCHVDSKPVISPDAISSWLRSLAYWRGDGRNHLLVYFSHQTTTQNPLKGVDTGRAIVGQTNFEASQFRMGFDAVLPNLPSFKTKDYLPPMVPALRDYALSFQGQWPSNYHAEADGDAALPPDSEFHQILLENMNLMRESVIHGNFMLQVQCQEERIVTPGFSSEWSLCGSEGDRLAVLSRSTFALILPAEDRNLLFTPLFSTRLIEALQSGAIPVLLGTHTRLPFSEFISWEKAAIILPQARVTELPFLLSNIPHAEIISMRRQGRFLYDTYLSTPPQVVESTLALLRTRLQIPALPVEDVPRHFLFNHHHETAIQNLKIQFSWGTGKVYQESLGGNSPWEQFTMVMLTYKREEVLLQAVERLIGLPHLNKIIVVWNSPEPPGAELRWPDVGVKVVVIHPEKNSLNNRFLPWSEINTEAVLSIDDDAHLRHDEILFGFRVWRESRHRVVGFPGRFHAWDPRHGGWSYNSNHTCELSMVLTGAAFLHKYYLYLYSNWMPPAVRAIVDQHMNCEDIAMNFLVSHVTRQSPVKVTSRWTFRCPGCPVALSQSQEHFDERHLCINAFVKIFGYMPLVYTQLRVDSILFKTRLPHDKQK
uniref:Exostosin-like 3 n=1 Tax=Ciona savignyi TaxID=51511 RepID=H2ZHK7_CIOSA